MGLGGLHPPCADPELPLQTHWVCAEANHQDHHPSVGSALACSAQITMFSSSRRPARVICVSGVSGQGDCSSLFLGVPLRAARQEEGGAQLLPVSVPRGGTDTCRHCWLLSRASLIAPGPFNNAELQGLPAASPGPQEGTQWLSWRPLQAAGGGSLSFRVLGFWLQRCFLTQLGCWMPADSPGR